MPSCWRPRNPHLKTWNTGNAADYHLDPSGNQKVGAESIVAVLADHRAAGIAIKKLGVAGFKMESLTVPGKGCHTEE